MDQDPEGKYEALAQYARDLTQAAREGKLDPVIGRDEQIRWFTAEVAGIRVLKPVNERHTLRLSGAAADNGARVCCSHNRLQSVSPGAPLLLFHLDGRYIRLCRTGNYADRQ